MNTQPTRRQCDDATRVHDVILHEANLLTREGVGPHELIAGMGSALADAIATAWGQEAVAKWFTAQGELIAALQEPKH